MTGWARMFRQTAATGGRSDSGFVTLLVLTFSGLMAALILSTMHVARPGIGQALLNANELQADGLIEAGIATAGYGAFASKKKPKAVNGTVVTLGTGTVRISLVPETGRIDINGTDKKMLESFYAAFGSGAMPPEAFSARLLDWRDSNDKVAQSGAESKEYNGAGLNYGPRNQPFQSVDELMFVLGISELEFQRLSPYLTVFNPEGMIDPRVADRAVLMAVPKISEAEVDEMLKTLRDPDAEDEEVEKAISRYADYLSIDDAQVFRLKLAAVLTNGFAKTAEAVIMAGRKDEPYRLLHYRVLYPEAGA